MYDAIRIALLLRLHRLIMIINIVFNYSESYVCVVRKSVTILFAKSYRDYWKNRLGPNMNHVCIIFRYTLIHQ